MTRETRECPYCQETIYAEALKCRWCGELMPDAPRTKAAGGPGGPAIRRRPPPVRDRQRERPYPEGASTILIFGILSWAVCIIFGALAWSKGNEYDRQCKALGLQPEGSATAGRILGMIHCVLLLVGVVVGVLVLVLVGISGGGMH